MRLSEKILRIATLVEKSADAKSKALSVLQEMQNAVYDVVSKYNLGIAHKLIQDKIQQVFGPQIENLVQKQEFYRLAALGYSESFDWKESQQADDWVREMTKKGYTTYSYNAGDDQIYLFAVKGGFNVLKDYTTSLGEKTFDETKYKQVQPDDLLMGILPQ